MKRETKFFKRIGFKITLWYSLSVLIILVIAGSFLYYRLQHKLDKEVKHLLLDESRDILQQTLKGNFDLHDIETAIERESSDQKFYKLSARLIDLKQNIIITSSNFFNPSLQVSEETITKAKKEGKTFDTIRIKGVTSPYCLLTLPVSHDGSLKYFLQVALHLRGAFKGTENFKENIMMLIPGLVIITVIGGWFIAKRSLAPVDKITKATQEITALSLNTRLKPTHTGDELDALTNTINLMLNRLENSFQKLVQFTSDVSHELRTPIATLKVGTEVALAEKMTVEGYNQLLERFLCQFENITKMIENLMVLLRSDSGTKVLNLKTFNLRTILKELCNAFSLVAEAKNVQFTINEIEDIQINGDEILIHRVFSNLLDNAIKYTPSGGHVYVSLKNSILNAMFSIKDTGIGIPENKKELIFDRFYRVDSSRSKETGGTGLGLSISKNIVELHNGKIEVESKLGIGSTFLVTLPKNGTA